MIVIEHPDPDPHLRKATLTRFLKRAQKAADLPGDITVLLADDARLKELNRTFRGKNKATDVLSFPAIENEEGIAGDLAISLDIARKQAAAFGHPLDEELRVLILHGVLHLAGYDHEVDHGEMADLELELRQQLGLTTNLIQRVTATPRRAATKAPTKAARTTTARKTATRARKRA